MECVENTALHANIAELLRATAEELKAEFRATVANLTATIEQLKQSIDQKNEHIRDLEQRVTKVVQSNVVLAGELSQIQNHICESVDVRIDDLEQYSRKPCLRVEGIPKVDGETNDILAGNVVAELNKYGAKISVNDIFRLHRIGRPRKKLNGERLPPQTIIRFQSWGARSRAYATKYTGTLNERKLRPAFVLLDLTKRRLNLLKKARVALTNHPVAHAYADAECRLMIKNRRTDTKTSFNTDLELNALLGDLLVDCGDNFPTA